MNLFTQDILNDEQPNSNDPLLLEDLLEQDLGQETKELEYTTCGCSTNYTMENAILKKSPRYLCIGLCRCYFNMDKEIISKIDHPVTLPEEIEFLFE